VTRCDDIEWPEAAMTDERILEGVRDTGTFGARER
jgi:hypothetical protein